jgi:K(+)-stimulated pyrophosphate-energized sodium pump
MINSGTAFRNAKRYVESGNLGGEETIAHKALITGNAVGDLFKDTALPLNILLKLMAIIALIIAPLL